MKFGTTAVTTFFINNTGTQIVVTSPAGSAATADVTVVTPGGTSATSAADQFSYVAAPTVTGISPTSGSSAGGTAVTITGTGFTGATAVDFGTTAATNVVVASATQITATSPAGTGVVDVTVVTPGGASPVNSPADQFSYVALTTTGLYNPSTSTFSLRNTNSAGNADATFVYGTAGAGWIPIAGDWDGSGTVTIGLYNPQTSIFYLRNTNTAGYVDTTFQYGPAGLPAGSQWIPLAGDWDGNGTDTVGLYNPVTSVFYLRNTNSLQSANDKGFADVTFTYGMPGAGWIPIAGDWNNDGKDTIGLYNPVTSVFYLRNTTSLQNASDLGYADVTFAYGAPGAGWKPIAGDWNGDGYDTMGLYDPSQSKFYLRNTTSLQGSGDKGYADVAFTFGTAGAGLLPIAGVWNGAGSPLMAAGGSVVASANVPTLSQTDLQPIVSEAIARWANAGLDAATLAKLTQVQFVISDLPGSYLGKAESDQVYIDTNAAGHGWFVDPTPAADEEFTATPIANQLQAVDPQAVDRIDLLTVVEHELGHVAGLGDLDALADNLMSGTLGVGVRPPEDPLARLRGRAVWRSLAQGFDDAGRDVADAVLVDVARARRAAAGRPLDIAEIGQDAPQHVLQRQIVDLLPVALHLPAPARLEPAQLHRRAKSLGKIGRVQHGVEQLQHAELQPHGLVDLSGAGQIVKLPRQLGHHAGGGIGAAIDAD